MSKKLNVKLSGIIFVVLLAIVVISQFFDGKDESTFKSVIVSVDTAQVSKIIIYPKDKNAPTVTISKENASWFVDDNGKKFLAENNGIAQILNTIAEIKPLRVAGKDKSKWEKYELTDSMATARVEIYDNQSKLTDFMIGKFSYQQPTNPYDRQGKMTTYVRLSNEEEVYAVDGFLSMTFNANANTFRNKTVLKSNAENWNKLTFSYPADSSFILSKNMNQWNINGMPVDSMIAVNFFNGIKNLSAREFANDFTEYQSPTHVLKIEGDNMLEPIVIKAFTNEDLSKVVLNSSQNKDSYIDDKQANLFKKLFVSPSRFKN